MVRLTVDIREQLLKSGKEEFLKSGFEGASLRTICGNAGLTTGAFYNHFRQKEDLFDALVEPMIEEFQSVINRVMALEKADLSTGVENELVSITYAITHRDEFDLLFHCSKGTKYEHFKDHLIHDVFLPEYQEVFDGYAGRHIHPKLVHMMLHMKFEEYMELIFGGYSMEEVRMIITQIALFSEAGFRGFIDKINQEE